MPKLTPDDIHAVFEGHLPRASRDMVVEETGRHHARVRLCVTERHLRPGGTVSGPSMMALADGAQYIAVMASIGPETLAVTTNLNINFLRKPPPRDIIAVATVLKLGKQLAVGEVMLRSEGEDAPVAHATITYSIPPGV